MRVVLNDFCMTFLINSIYLATEGEGINIGVPQVFVRFQGCSIGCKNCDSKDTWNFSTEKNWNLGSVLYEIEKYQIKRVSITGGEPLHETNRDSVFELIKNLKAKNYYINLETSGQMINHAMFDLIDFISVDFKTPSSGIEGNIATVEMLREQYQGRFQIKSVIETEEDFNFVLSAYSKICKNKQNEFPWILTPSYKQNEPFPQQRFHKVIELNERANGPFRVIGQQHKWLHGPDKKQV